MLCEISILRERKRLDSAHTHFNEMHMEDSKSNKSKGAGSFSIPRRAIETLLANQANAYEICTYLTLARFTDDSGCYSTASITAVNRHTGANKTRGGPVDRAIERLKGMRAKKIELVSNGRNGKSRAMIEKTTDLGPLVIDRAAWCLETGEILPDGPTERGKVRHVLPDFSEPQDERVWFGNNLVTGVGGFNQPLKELKNAGDVAARLLLAMYEVNDMEAWGGVQPVGAGFGPWVHYEPVDTDTQWSNFGVKLHRAKRGDSVGPGGMFSRVYPLPVKPGSWWDAHRDAGEPVWQALEALNSAGLVYEVVMALNRNAIRAKFPSGTEYSSIPEGAEPLYELDCRSKHGYKPDGEEGVGWATAKTAGDFGKPVTLEGGTFDGTYAAFVSQGYGVMIAGIYRLRFRVSNPKNAGVKGAWAGIFQRNKDALNMINRMRTQAKLQALEWPSDRDAVERELPIED